MKQIVIVLILTGIVLVALELGAFQLIGGTLSDNFGITSNTESLVDQIICP